MKKHFVRLGTVLLALVMVLSMGTAAFAAHGNVDSDSTDYLTNHTNNNTVIRQANSNNTGTIRLGKILTVNQQNKFPNIEDFVYKITPVAAWDNSNVDTTLSGKNIAPADMPKPQTNNTEHHKVTGVSPDDSSPDPSAPWATLVSIGNFKDANADNPSSIYGDKDHKYVNSDDKSNTKRIGDKRRRTRTTDVNIKFAKAGYYMYKIEEVGSRQNGAVDGLSGLRKDVAGVDYDDNFYYVVFYVCNKQATDYVNNNEYGQGTQKGDTLGQEGYLNKVNGDGTQAHLTSEDGVYVHTITSWTNQNKNAEAGKNATDYRPDNSMKNSQSLPDTQNWIRDLMNSSDVDRANDDGRFSDGGHDAQLNTGKTDDNNKGIDNGKPVAKSNGTSGTAGDYNAGPSTVTHDNLGKVGISTPQNPNFLEAYRMWNDQVTHDIVLKKNVTGNLGDREKDFVFTVKLAGLEYNQTYTTNVAAGTTEETETIFDDRNRAYAGAATKDETSARVKMYDMEGGAALAADGKSFTTDNTGTATFKVKLKDDDILVINALPRTASYQVIEHKSDHVAQYNIVSTNKDTTNKAVFTETGHTPGGSDAAHLGSYNTESNRELATKVEFVDRYDGTVTIIYENNRDIATLTGINGIDYVVYAAALGLLAMTALVIVRRRREYAEEDFLA